MKKKTSPNPLPNMFAVRFLVGLLVISSLITLITLVKLKDLENKVESGEVIAQKN